MYLPDSKSEGQVLLYNLFLCLLYSETIPTQTHIFSIPRVLIRMPFFPFPLHFSISGNPPHTGKQKSLNFYYLKIIKEERKRRKNKENCPWGSYPKCFSFEIRIEKLPVTACSSTSYWPSQLWQLKSPVITICSIPMQRNYIKDSKKTLSNYRKIS